ncbi:MAG: SDR family NAD(P)-dependent oxidoreductase [Sphingomonas sp.]
MIESDVVTGNQDHGASFAGQRCGHGQADTPGPTGYECPLARQSKIHDPSLSFVVRSARHVSLEPYCRINTTVLNTPTKCGGAGELMKLLGKVAIVTGTSPNIGGGIAEALAAEGATIVAIDARRENAEACAEAIRVMGGQAIGIRCNVVDEGEVTAAVEQAVASYGRIDILVNNAAIFNQKDIATMTLMEWRQVTSIILDGAFLFTKYATANMVPHRSGVVINVVSTAGHQGQPGNIAYTTAKAGMLNFTRSAAMEYARHGIRVVSLTPTATEVGEMIERARRWNLDLGPLPDYSAITARFASRIPMKALPKPSDYGAAAVFLASDDAAMITGSDLRVDGGAVARYWAWEPTDD